MKTINETFTDDEYKAIEHIKRKHGYTWHDAIIAAFESWEQHGNALIED